MFGWLRKKKEDAQERATRETILTQGILSADLTHGTEERKVLEDIGTNILLIRSNTTLRALEAMEKLAGESDEIDFDMLASAILQDHIIRVSNLSPLQAKIGYLKSRIAFRQIKMNSPDFPGFNNFIDAMEIENYTAWHDSIDGWKAKLTKVSPKEFQITMRQQQEKSGLLKR